jgi:hypothetical protein
MLEKKRTSFQITGSNIQREHARKKLTADDDGQHGVAGGDEVQDD